MVLAKMPKIVLPASFEGESRVRRGLFLRYEQELTNEYPVQTRKEKYGFSKNNFRNQRKNGQKWSFLTVFQRLRSTFDPRQFSDAILSAFLAPISDGIYPFLGVLIPPDRNRGLRRLLSASVSFLSHPDEWGRLKGSRAGLHALDRPWNRRMEPLLLWFAPFSLSRIRQIPFFRYPRSTIGLMSWVHCGPTVRYGICISNLPGISLFVKFSNKLVDTV